MTNGVTVHEGRSIDSVVPAHTLLACKESASSFRRPPEQLLEAVGAQGIPKNWSWQDDGKPPKPPSGKAIGEEAFGPHHVSIGGKGAAPCLPQPCMDIGTE